MPGTNNHADAGASARLRRTGSRSRGGAVAPLSGRGGRTSIGGGGLSRGGGNAGYAWIVVLVAVAFAIWLQSRWMKEQKQRALDGTRTVSNGFADKAADWMLRKRGLAPEKASSGGSATTPFDRSDRRIDCVACGGLGAAYGDDGKPHPCGICQGVGYRMIRPFDELDLPCSACGGMGRIETEDGAAETCPRCDGRGFVRPAP